MNAIVLIFRIIVELGITRLCGLPLRQRIVNERFQHTRQGIAIRSQFLEGDFGSTPEYACS